MTITLLLIIAAELVVLILEQRAQSTQLDQIKSVLVDSNHIQKGD